MLPDVLIHLPDFDSQVRARDLPTGAFFLGFPDDLPFTDCYRSSDWARQQEINVGLESWVTGIVTLAVVDPRLTRESVHRLGPSRDLLAKTYLEVVGWLKPNPDAVPPELAPGTRRRRPPLPLAALTARPGKNLQGILRHMAMRTRRLASELWAAPVSEFLFNMNCLADPQPDDEFKRALGLDA